jgi:UDP-2-acetamido-3-amino-2,3-dideoxy-glucuronate N-acetyltransferase
VSLGVLKAVFDKDHTILENIRREYPEVLCASSFDEMLRHPDIRAVAIAAPAKTHYELARRTLIAGKDVFVEKPLSLRVEEGQELVELARSKNRILMVGHILHYHPAVRKLKEMLQDGVIGDVQYIYAHRLNTGRIRAEENVLWSFAPHDVSVFISLLGEDPLRVRAFGSDQLARGIHDTVLVTLEFAGSVKGHIFVSWLHPFKEQRLVLVGSRGMIVFDDVATEKLLLYPHKVEWGEGKIPVVEKAACKIISVEDREPLREELSCFVECIQKHTNPPTDGEEGLRVLRVLEAADRSLGGGM